MVNDVLRMLFVLIVALACAAAAEQAPPPAWPDTFEARVQALAMIQTLNADILASRSATASLEKWCRDHRLAAEPSIIAIAVRTNPVTVTADQRQRLEIATADAAKYRRVQLRCGSHVLSEAENWYVPGRLTADMNRALETTDTPFGRVVAPLGPYRRTFAATQLWRPPAEGWSKERALALPNALFEHRAVLYTREHRPFSEVHEVYQRAILAFPLPR